MLWLPYAPCAAAPTASSAAFALPSHGSMAPLLPLSEGNREFVEEPLVEVLSGMLDEGDGVSDAQLELLLSYLVPPRINEAPEAAR